MVNAGRANAAAMRRLIMIASVPVLVAAARALLRFGFQQKRAFDDNRLAGLQPRYDLDVVAQIASAANRAHLVLVLALWNERQPPRAYPLHGRRGNRENRAALSHELEPGAGRHARAQDACWISQCDADRDGA